LAMGHAPVVLFDIGIPVKTVSINLTQARTI
jgi:hypothetical protein